jgi:hypothetical protein
MNLDPRSGSKYATLPLWAFDLYGWSAHRVLGPESCACAYQSAPQWLCALRKAVIWKYPSLTMTQPPFGEQGRHMWSASLPQLTGEDSV